jgi:hypothetical protein
LGVKLIVLLPNITTFDKKVKSFPIPMWNTSLEKYFQILQYFFWELSNWSPYARVINLKNKIIHNLIVSRVPLESFRYLFHFNAILTTIYIVYYREKNDDFLTQIWIVVNHVNVCFLWFSLCQLNLFIFVLICANWLQLCEFILISFWSCHALFLYGS